MLGKRQRIIMASLLIALLPAVGTTSPSISAPTTEGAATLGTIDPLAPYRGLGTWVDIYDNKEFKNPEAAVAKMKLQGIRTLYLETANYRLGKALFRKGRLGRFIEAAHANDIKVIAWYLPGFDDLERDLKRSRKAIRFRSEGGERFDGFALDIEATVVRAISKRNRRAIKLSKQIEKSVHGDYVLGAIIPDPAGQLYWPDFPYKRLAAIYDVFLPMGYYTYRVSGGKAVYRYSKRNVTILRKEAGKPDLPVHNIGGIAGAGTKREATRFIDGSLDAGVIGGSLYDFPLTTQAEWKRLARFNLLP